MFSRLLWLVLSVWLLPLSVFSDSTAFPNVGKIDGMASLPISGLNAVETNGEVLFLSDNGRFAIRGTLYDVWAQQPLQTLEAVRQADNTLDLKRLGLDISDLRPLTLGTGKKIVVIFVDPRCPHCHTVLQQAQKLVDDYTFQLLPVPVLGPDSEQQVRLLGCASDRNAALSTLLSGRINGLSQIEDCNLEPPQRTLVTAQILGIQGVPFLIAPDGRISRGHPADLSVWLTTQ